MTPGSAVRLASVARHVIDCVRRPGYVWSMLFYLCGQYHLTCVVNIILPVWSILPYLCGQYHHILDQVAHTVQIVDLCSHVKSGLVMGRP